jgi:hypothetical protein
MVLLGIQSFILGIWGTSGMWSPEIEELSSESRLVIYLSGQSSLAAVKLRVRILSQQLHLLTCWFRAIIHECLKLFCNLFVLPDVDTP